MQYYKYHKLSSKVLVFLMIFTLVISPFQTIAYASTVESDQVEDNLNGENELENDTELESETAVSRESTDTELPKEDSDDSNLNVETEPNEETEVSDDAVETTEEENNEDSTEETEVDKNEIEENHEDKNEDFDYSNFDISIDDVTTTSDSVTITWSTTQEFTGEFELFLNYNLYATVSSDTYTHTFTDLTPREDYDIEVSAVVSTNDDSGYWPYFNDTVWVTPDWSEEELVPVSIITMFNENPTNNEKIRIRGLDDGNKAFHYNEWIWNSDSDLYLPLGKFEITLYNQEDPSIATVETFEIK